MPRRTLVAIAGLLAGLVLMPAAANAASLYSGPDPRPGPDILYQPPATAPQLTNAGYWLAKPILISGVSAYRRGEFLYQDYLYDDHGSHETFDPADPRSSSDTFAKPNGTYSYPTNPAYANNAADLVELRVKPLRPSTGFRITLNTMKDPSLIAFSIALGGTAGNSHPFPYGANVSAPADLFVTVHPNASGTLVGDIRNATTGELVAATPVPTVDTTRRQIEVRVPHTVWDPTGKVVRLAAGVGLWDNANNRWLIPQQAADATHPGGAGNNPAPPAFFNVAFRYNEPMPQVGDPSGTAQSPAWWRDKAQGEALHTGDISAFHADVDFSKLATDTIDDSTVPTTGPMDRILASHFETAQGVDYSATCFPGNTSNCTGWYRGNLQPYSIYIPTQPQPAAGYGMTLLLHSLSATYNQFLGSRNQSQFGERGPGSIVITPLARGLDGFYDSYAAADVFEVWADVASRYTLDPMWTVITGYSMGGIGTFKLGEQFPDLFARAQPTVGYSQDNALIPSLRNIPVLMWNASSDELVPQSSYLPTAQALDSANYRYELDVFSGDHLTLAINDQYAPAAAFLGTAKVNRNPAHVTYVYDPGLDHPELGFVGNHAYWISGITPRSAGSQATVDAFSYGFGTGDPTASATQFGSGTLTGGNLGTLAFSRQYKTWGDAPPLAAANRIDMTTTNVSELTINPYRAKDNCRVDWHVTSDGPLTIHMNGCNRVIHVP